ncbi:amino acid permease [Streptococcus macacae]|uniref:Amino acid permease n=1 Tax=Streptococcus macacae NCTC 11558 TaxID=764298 RepID=G5JXL3_9STRE|nr:amino acid permease [Streptococcus macacae]EHJ51993.1 amino acid permease [Streptococcus macacae NCTC 11558]SUN77572.1 amino acid permease [Streptococcus macacae NCTC 11558]
MNIFRKKNTTLDRTEMKRHLKIIDLVFLGLGSMVGTGIFTITGIGAANYAGPALVISIAISAIAVGISALFYAEFASRIPANGGAYSYLYATLGEFPAWLTGWYIIMEFLTAVSGVASGWGSYLKGLLSNYNIQLPKALNGTFNPSEGTYIDLFPVLVIFLVTGIVLLNSKIALRFNSSLVIMKFSALILFITVGLFYIKPENWSNFSPFGFGQLYGGKTGIMSGASLMFFAFLGFESISMAVDEVKEPQKNIPRGIIASLSIVTVLYISVTLVLTGIIPYKKLNVADAVAFSLRSIGLNWAANYISVIATLTLITVCISMTYALARTVYSISRDGLLPKQFSVVTKHSKVPKNATLLVGFVSMVCAGVFPLSSIAEFLNICTLAYLILLAIGIIKLRKNEGKAKEGEFNTPLVPLLPIISIIICFSLMSQYKIIIWVAFGISTIIGILTYLFYGYKNSTINQK